jgi:hypothetical protein
MRSWRELAVPKTAALAYTLVLCGLVLQGNIGLNMADEGFLWYGSIRTAAGEVPLRDFQSYDPGRYYWTAPWLQILGTGILALRIAQAMFQGLGLTLGLLALRRFLGSYWMLAAAGGVLLIWLYPRHKPFEPSIAMAAVYVGVLLLENPTLWRHLVAGIFVGGSAIIGRNMGLYLLISFAGLLLFLRLRRDLSNCRAQFAVWAAGILLGYSPVLAMFVWTPGFFASFVESLMPVEGPAVSIPIPWPWLVDYSKMAFLSAVEGFLTGAFFLFLPLTYVSLITLWCLCPRDKLQERYVLIASSFVGITYMHHAFSRADFSHLAQSIHPFLLILLGSIFSTSFSFYRFKVSRLFIIILFSISFLSIGRNQPLFVKASAPAGAYVKVDVTGYEMWLDSETAHLVTTLHRVNMQKLASEDFVLIAPFFPALYPILGKVSPWWELFHYFYPGEAMQRAMIETLAEKKVNWAILADRPFVGYEELRFRHSHAIVWQYLQDRFEPVPIEGLPGDFQVLHRRR